MKKIIITLVSSIFLLFGNANALGLNLGLSGAAGVFEVDGATEKNADATINAADEKEDAEGLYAIGSAFAEVTFTDRIAIGVDYVPHSLETNQVSNEKEVLAGTGKTVGTNVTNTAEVHIEDLTTVYASFSLNDNFYVKAGYAMTSIDTTETLATGTAYGNETVEGYTVGVGLAQETGNGGFWRLEGTYSDYEDADFNGTLLTEASASVRNKVNAELEAVALRFSIGKQF